VTGKEIATVPLWECLSPCSLAMLITYQRKIYGLKLDLHIDPYKEIEDLKEIAVLMQERRKMPR